MNTEEWQRGNTSSWKGEVGITPGWDRYPLLPQIKIIMAAVPSVEKKLKRLAEQVKKYKDNPKISKRLAGRVAALTPKKKK